MEASSKDDQQENPLVGQAAGELPKIVMPKFELRSGTQDDLAVVTEFLQPMMDQQLLLGRTSMELQLLLKHSFLAVALEESANGAQGSRLSFELQANDLIGFCALEIYSKKLAEIQCLAVSPTFRRQGVGKALVQACVGRARNEKVLELMAISNSEDMFRACGFDYSLPNQKRAFFFQP